MRFYKQPSDQQPHRFYCGVDLHARCMYVCILDAAGPVPGPEGAKEHSPGRRPGNQRPTFPEALKGRAKRSPRQLACALSGRRRWWG